MTDNSGAPLSFPPQYPEHEKLAAVQDHSQAIGQFLDTCRYQICELMCLNCGQVRPSEDCCRRHRPEYLPLSKSIQTVLAEYFEIDQDKLEAEKRAMLQAIRGD